MLFDKRSQSIDVSWHRNKGNCVCNVQIVLIIFVVCEDMLSEYKTQHGM